MSDSESLVFAAERVVAILDEYRIDAVVIGAVALAAYHYVRHTEYVDLGVNDDLAQGSHRLDVHGNTYRKSGGMTSMSSHFCGEAAPGHSQTTKSPYEHLRVSSLPKTGRFLTTFQKSEIKRSAILFPRWA